MNNTQFELNQIIYPNLDLQSNLSSPSLSNPTTQNSDYIEEPDNKIISNLLQYICQNNPKDFRNFLSLNSNLLSSKQLENIFLYTLQIYISGKIYASRFLSILIPFGINPNIILNKNTCQIEGKENKEEFIKGESILMLFCSKSDSALISNLCESKINLNVNYIDLNRRNALFYLKGGNDDKKIIELLVQKGINSNQKDIEGNTCLHNAINIRNKQLIYNLINIGNTNFMIKNNQNYNSLELIIQKWISRKNINMNKFNIIEYKDIKLLIELIKNKLSIKQYENESQIPLSDNQYEKNLISNNLIKLPFNMEKKDLTKEDNNISNNNIFLRVNHKNNPSLIVDTQFNDGKNNISSSNKIEYYKQMNKNKKDFINLLNNSKNFIDEKMKKLKEEIEIRKKKLEEDKIYKNSKKDKLDLINENHKNELFRQNKEIEDIKNKIGLIKNKLINNKNNTNLNSNNLVEIKPKLNYLEKYNSMIIRNEINKQYIYEQLHIDLLDYTEYVHYKNSKLKNTISKIKQLLKESVQNCLGKNYDVKVYGSRETGLCLPWSDIDLVISFKENEYNQPLNKLYLYLKNNYNFIDIKYIEYTQIPLIKIITTNDYYNISLDISLELPEHHGAECVCFIKEKIKEYEILTPLTLAMKTIFQKAKINDPYTGGLSSYGIILLIINFIKMKQREGTDISLKNLGKIFYELLYYYGTKYNIKEPIDINENDKKKIEGIHLLNNSSNDALIIVDPLNIYNNVARNVRQFINIRFALRIALACLNESCECGCHYQYEGLCLKEQGCEHNLLNNIFNSIKRT